MMMMMIHDIDDVDNDIDDVDLGIERDNCGLCGDGFGGFFA